MTADRFSDARISALGAGTATPTGPPPHPGPRRHDHRGSWLHRPGAQLAKYSAVAGVAVRTHLAYLADFFLRSLFLVVIMFAFFQLWRTTFGTMGAERIGGFSLREMMWYLAMTESLVLSMPRLSFLIDEQVKTGQLAYFLCRPHNYLLYLFGTYIGETLVRFPVNLLIAGGLAFATVGPPPLEAGVLPGLAAAVLLGFSLNFIIVAAIGLLAFWSEDTSSFYLLYSRFLMIVGGMLIPLDVMPEAVRRVAALLPTNLIVYGPARLFVGHGARAAEVWALLGRQGLWLLILGLGLAWLYRLGVKRVNVQGG